MEKQLFENILQTAMLNNSIEHAIKVHNISNPADLAELRRVYSERIRNKQVARAHEEERARAACGYAGNPTDQKLLHENAKAVAELIEEETERMK